MPVNACKLCNKEELCFHCNFWQEKVDIKDRDDVARIDGYHYIVGRETEKYNKGHSGREFLIRFFDGREVRTTNLWSQGKIPERFDLPDNAEFM